MYDDIKITISYLTMNRPQQAVSLPVLPSLSDSAISITEVTLDVATHHQYYRAIGEKWFWWERLTWDDIHLAKHLARDVIKIYRLDVDGVFAGYSELDFSHHKDGKAYLAYFGLAPDYIGQGLGSYFLTMMQYHLFHDYGDDVQLIEINTCTLDHPNALGFYQKYGFKLSHTQDSIIADPRGLDLIPSHYAIPNTL